MCLLPNDLGACTPDYKAFSIIIVDNLLSLFVCTHIITLKCLVYPNILHSV